MVLRGITVLPVSSERAFAFFEAMDRPYRVWHPDHLAFRWVEGQGVAARLLGAGAPPD